MKQVSQWEPTNIRRCRKKFNARRASAPGLFTPVHAYYFDKFQARNIKPDTKQFNCKIFTHPKCFVQACRIVIRIYSKQKKFHTSLPNSDTAILKANNSRSHIKSHYLQVATTLRLPRKFVARERKGASFDYGQSKKNHRKNTYQ